MERTSTSDYSTLQCSATTLSRKRAKYRRWLDAQAAYPSVAHNDKDHYTCMALHRVASCVCHQCASGSNRRAILQPRRLTLSSYRVTWTSTRLNSRSADKLSIKSRPFSAFDGPLPLIFSIWNVPCRPFPHLPRLSFNSVPARIVFGNCSEGVWRPKPAREGKQAETAITCQLQNDVRVL